MRRLFSTLLLSMTLLTLARPAKCEIVVDFEELTTFTGNVVNGGSVTGQFFNGNDGSGTSSAAPWLSQGVSFGNNYTNFGTFDAWEGWAYSNVVDTTTPGFFNEYAAAPGGGSNGAGGVDVGGNYAVAFTGSSVTATGAPQNGSTFTLAETAQLNSVDLALTTYANLYIRDGVDGFGTPDFDPFAQFGPTDFFQLDIIGFDGVNGTGAQTNQISVDLATGNTFRMEDWTVQDLSSLGMVRSVTFQLSSSQFTNFPTIGTFMDNPAYVAIDNLRIVSVPEPSSIVLMLAGTSLGFVRRRRTLG